MEIQLYISVLNQFKLVNLGLSQGIFKILILMLCFSHNIFIKINELYNL